MGKSPTSLTLPATTFNSSPTGVEALKAEVRFICSPVPMVVISLSAILPSATIAVLISPRILSAVIVVSVSNGVGAGLTNARSA